jgi:hypothetical protein
MKSKITLSALGMLLLATCQVLAQDTVFFSGFEYDGLFPIIVEPVDMNGAEDQVGEWSGDEFPEGTGDILILPDSVGIVPSPYGGNLLVVDRPTGDADGNDFIGSYFADFSKSIGIVGTEVFFNVGTRRTGGNHNKDYDIVGRDSNGEESFHLRVGTNNNGAERIGVVSDGGNSVVFDLPTAVGDDQPNDLDNMGGFSVEDGPGFGAEIANVRVRLGAEGYTVDFSYPEEGTSSFKNAYTTSQLPYNGSATEIAQLQFTYSASPSAGVNSGYVLDNVTVTGFDSILLGDFNFDGAIDSADYVILQDNFGTGSTFEQGDFNFDGAVGLADFIALKAAFNAPAGAATAASVPEPTSFSLLGIGVVVLLPRRRRSRVK